MANCATCYTSIGDARKAKHCKMCFSPLHADCAINDDGVFCDTCYVIKGENEQAFTFEVPEEIRRTYIETYRTCPKKFLEEVINGAEQPPTIYTQLGIDLHDLFDYCSNVYIHKDEMLNRYTPMFAAYEDSLFIMNTTRENMWQRALTCIDNFYKVLPTFPQKPFITEETIRFSIGDDLPKVRFTMDRIDEIDGELELLDYKTGKVMVGQKLSTDLQAPLYIYGTIQHYQRPVRKFTFYYLNEDKERTFIRSAIDPDKYECRVKNRTYIISLQDTIRELNKIFSSVKKGHFQIPTDTRNMHFACKMCHIKEQGKCRGASEEGWHQSKGW